MPASLQRPDQELRFTRAGQAQWFWLLSAVLLSAGLTLLATGIYRHINPEVPHPLWALLPLLLAVGAGQQALRLTRHAYLILTPLGIEVFPFYRPQHGMRIVYWHEIAEIEVTPSCSWLTLHHNAEKTSGVHLSLRPIRPDRREWLVEAISSRLEDRAAAGASQRK